MIIGIIVNIAVGILLIVFGMLIWKRQMVKLLHDYHYKNVKEADMPAYTRLIGIGLIIIGAGICSDGVLNYFESHYWWLPLALGFICGFTVMHRAQMKYNGSWLS